jgi:hypothetical protein
MRNLIVIGCATVLALSLSMAAFAGSITDTDTDGVPDTLDNCEVAANGPLIADANNCFQTDGDEDGYGNACDVDLSNNGVNDLPDLLAVLSALGTVDPAADVTCNGAVDLPDLLAVLSGLGGAPGPSGLSCAGAIPCLP